MLKLGCVWTPNWLLGWLRYTHTYYLFSIMSVLTSKLMIPLAMVIVLTSVLRKYDSWRVKSADPNWSNLIPYIIQRYFSQPVLSYLSPMTSYAYYTTISSQIVSNVPTKLLRNLKNVRLTFDKIQKLHCGEICNTSIPAKAVNPKVSQLMSTLLGAFHLDVYEVCHSVTSCSRSCYYTPYGSYGNPLSYEVW